MRPILAFGIVAGLIGPAAAQQQTRPMIIPGLGTHAHQYATEAEAKRACGSDPVVWANLETKVLHPPGDPFYGHTKRGAYVCQSAALKDGMHNRKDKG